VQQRKTTGVQQQYQVQAVVVVVGMTVLLHPLLALVELEKEDLQELWLVLWQQENPKLVIAVSGDQNVNPGQQQMLTL